MKKTILYLCLITLIACDSDLEKVHYHASDAKPAVLQAIDGSYVLNAQESEQTAIQFMWDNPVVNYPAAITTDLQMDISGNNFADAMTLASTKTDSTYSISTADLNAAVIKLQADEATETVPLSVEFRLVSIISSAATPLYSNVISSLITPFEEED